MSSCSALIKYFLSCTLKKGYYPFTVNRRAPECYFPFMYILGYIISSNSVTLIPGLLGIRASEISLRSQ